MNYRIALVFAASQVRVNLQLVTRLWRFVPKEKTNGYHRNTVLLQSIMKSKMKTHRNIASLLLDTSTVTTSCMHAVCTFLLQGFVSTNFHEHLIHGFTSLVIDKPTVRIKS